MKLTNFQIEDAKLNNEIYEKIKTIGLFTKTSDRVKPINSTIIQPTLLYYLCTKYNIQNFFEIGTGRGTTSLTVSLIPHIKKVITLDILPFNKKRNTYVNFKPEFVSNKDLYDLIPYPEKKKITYLNNTSFTLDLDKYKNQFDLVFIDANHKVDKYIEKDFEIAEELICKNGIIVMDDYGPNWATTRVIDNLIKTRKDLKFTLIQTMKKENHGHVLIEKI
jgi:predicted O-methyltransferase YrrM